MTRTARRVVLAAVATVAFALLTVFLTGDLSGDERRPADDVAALGRWMAAHPADSRAAAAIAATALDSELPRRIELWRASYEHSLRLAPRRTGATTAFVRGGLFHWYELGPAERKAVLDAAAPLLRDQRTFTAMHRPLWELTHDFAYLRRNAPNTEKARTWLRDIAAMHGLFDEYRRLRGKPSPPAEPPEAIPSQWTGTCGRNEVCERAVRTVDVARAGQAIDIAVANAQSDEVPPYVEVYIGATLAAEGPVTDAKTFRVTAPSPGLHRIEVRLANPWTRNRIQRRVRLS